MSDVEEELSANTLAPGSRIASYEIVRVIGRGGMGIVYEGKHEALGKRVAIKTLIAAGVQSQDLVARFVREGKAAARIHHAHVVDVFDVGVHEGTPYLVMEFLEGEDLGSLLQNRAPMKPQEIADLMIPVISALAAAHDAGVVHRDLKPDNVFVTRGKGGAPVPKLLDFGISKLDDAQLNLTGTNAILGTPYYMSPEQAGSSRTVDHRSDVYSMGVILYQCATRELPFKGDSLFQLLGAIMHSEPPPVRSIAEHVPTELEMVIARAMQKNPARRYQTALQLGAALLPFASQRVRLAHEHEFAAAGEAIAAMPTLALPGTEATRTPLPATSEVPPEAPAQKRSPLGVMAVLGILVAAGIAFAIMRSGGEEPATNVHVATPGSDVAAPVNTAPQPVQEAPPPVQPAAEAIAPVPAAPDAGTAKAAPEPAPVAHDKPSAGKDRKPRSRKAGQTGTSNTTPPQPQQPAQPSQPRNYDPFSDRK